MAEILPLADKGMGSGTFRYLRAYNYRLWAGGSLISNIGTWMQRTAQDWLVLTELTHHSATAVGLVMGLQFGPQRCCCPGPAMRRIASTGARY
jgi:hypothetical protein